MEDSIVTTQAFADGEVGLSIEDMNGEVFALKTSPTQWRHLIRMLNHQISVSECQEMRSPTHPYTMGTA